ncbi:MAG: hypothetical protein KF886_11855 [Candidatus Hydrogenedentes bacterium]|nr:hypothetical protein [Candidatus Hydrogenedentota bacterium]
MSLLISCAALLGILSSDPGAPVILDNGRVRLEVDPRVFGVRFAGFSGGPNFLDTVFPGEPQRPGAPGIDIGGFVADVLPRAGDPGPRRHAPAEIVEHDARYVLLLGPEDPETHWRVKKEFFLERDSATVRCRTALLTSRKVERSGGLRLTAQVARTGTVMLPRTEGEIGLYWGTFPGLAELRRGPEDWARIPVSGRGRDARAVLVAPVTAMVMEAPFGRWTRRLESPEAGGGPGGRGRMFIVVDDRSHVCQVTLEVTGSGINAGAPLVVEEIWTFESEAGAPRR